LSALRDKGSERAVLSGLCLFGRDAYVDVEDIINVDSFMENNNKILYRCLEECFKEGVDKLDATEIFSASTRLNYQDLVIKDNAMVEYIRSLFNFPIHLENIRKHAETLIKLQIGRMTQLRLQEALDKTVELNGTEDISDILAIAESATFGLIEDVNNTSSDEPTLMGDGLTDYLEDLADNPRESIGIPTPWPNYNACVGGGLRVGVNLFCARPKTGKTTLAVNSALHITQQGIPVLKLDTEMSISDISHKVVANQSGVNITSIETGTFGSNDIKRQQVLEGAKEIAKLPYYHVNVAGKEFDEVLSIARRWIHKVVGFDEDGKTKPHAIIYDYFKLMNSDSLKSMQEYQSMGFQISQMHDFCQRYNSPVMAFVQVNRDGVGGEVNTSIISQSDRLLWLCVSACVYKRKTAEERGVDGTDKGNMKMYILESRFGPSLDLSDFICMEMEADEARISELGLMSVLQTQTEPDQRPQGFEDEE